ncbi:MAG: S-adenosyl-l-methionine hydroxide adenosyltransferase family protein [Planctomycetota bacterium]
MIVFLSDFGVDSPYAGICKGIILSINPLVEIVDLTHQLVPYNVELANFILKNSWSHFPVHSIFLCIVDPGVGGRRKLIIIKTHDKFFVGPDNGVFSFLSEENIEKIIAIDNKTYFSNNITHTFHGRYILAPVSAFLSLGTCMDNFGRQQKKIYRIPSRAPIYRNGEIYADVINVDTFGNLIANVEEEFIKKCFRGVPFKKLKITIDDKFELRGISKTYSDVKKGEPVALINSFGLLEIAINQGNASRYFEIGCASKIKITVVS